MSAEDTSGTVRSRSSWVLPLEAKNLIKFLTDAEPTTLQEYPDDERSSSGSNEPEGDLSQSYDFDQEDVCLNESSCSDALSSISAEVLKAKKGGSRKQVYSERDRLAASDSAFNSSNESVGDSFMQDSAWQPVRPLDAAGHGTCKDSYDDAQTQNLLNKVKRLTHGFGNPAHPRRHPQNVFEAIEGSPSDQLDAADPLDTRYPASSRFEIADYRAEIVRLRALLTEEKDKFRNLQVSTGVHQELQRTPEFELSLVDFVRLQCADVWTPLQEEVRQLRMLNELQQRSLEEAQHTITSQAAGMEVQQRLGDSSVEAYKMEARAASERCDRLAARLSAVEAEKNESDALAGRCLVAEGERDQMREELVMLRERWEQQGRVLMSLNETERSLRADLNDLTKQKDMLELDKSYLSRELANMNMKYEAESRLVDAQKLQTSGMESKVQELTEKLLQLQLTHRSEFDSRLQSEVRQMKERAQQEMEELKSTSKEIIDRENKVLREAKASLEGQLQSARAELTIVTSKLDKSREQLFAIQSSKDSDIAMLRAESKLSSYNLSATSANYEERCAQLRQMSLELAQSREEANTLRTAVQQLEAQAGRDLLDVTAERDSLRHKLIVYDALETNIDQAVVMVASSEGAGTRGPKGELHPVLQDFVHYPMDPSRRLSQCLAAVSRALAVERERDALASEMAQTKATLAEKIRQLEVANGALARVPHPHGYLLNKARALDDTISKQTQQLLIAEKKAADLTARLEAETKARALVQQRLDQLLKQRAEVEGLRVLLERMQDYEENEVNASSSESEESDDETIGEKQNTHSRILGQVSSREAHVAESAQRCRGGPVDKLNKTWNSTGSGDVCSPSQSRREDAYSSPQRSPGRVGHHNPPKGMSPDLFIKMTSPYPEKTRNADTLTSDFGSGHQSHFDTGLSVTPMGKSPAWHKRDTLH